MGLFSLFTRLWLWTLQSSLWNKFSWFIYYNILFSTIPLIPIHLFVADKTVHVFLEACDVLSKHICNICLPIGFYCYFCRIIRVCLCCYRCFCRILADKFVWIEYLVTELSIYVSYVFLLNLERWKKNWGKQCNHKM